MKVAVYHPFHDLPDNYSLSHVVREQLLMLTEHKVETWFVTSKGFDDVVPEGVNVAAILSSKPADTIRDEASAILEDIDYVFTHDIVYLDAYRPHLNALLQVAESHPHIRWLHWSHSAPSGTKTTQPFPNSYYISMNRTDLPLVAEQFNTQEAFVKVIYNSVSPDVYFGWHPFTRMLVEKHKLLDCDVLITYPLDTGRFDAKGGFKIIKLIEKIRDEGKNGKVVFVNAAANTEERTSIVKGLSNEYTIFTSLEDERYEVVVPRHVVRQLFMISNVFPLLSISEGCSLTMLEAALTKNLVILNEDFPPMKEFGEIDHTLYMKTSSTRCTTTYDPSEDNYYRDWARIIINQVESNKVLRFNRKILRLFNREWIWRNQLAPLLT